jgi:glycosyltransferase involved in cell wall biosynthesis
MRIGLVTSYMQPHHGGIEQVAEQLFLAYSSREFEVRWVASRIPRTAAAREGGRIRVPCWNGFESLLGIPVPLWGYSGLRELAKLSRWANVLHVHDCLYPSSALATFLAHGQAKPVLLSQHIGFTRYRFPGLNAIEWLAYHTLGRWVLRRAAHVVLVTPRAQDYIPRLMRDTLDVSTIPNGIDIKRFKPAGPADRGAARARMNLPMDAKIALFAGRLVANKGIDIVLDVARTVPAILFLIVGDGPLRHLLKNAPANVVWRPWVSQESMPDCYLSADCLLLPSVDEGLPIVVQEALACGLPAVVSDGELYAIPLVQAGACTTTRRTPESMTARLNEVISGRLVLPGGRAYAEVEWNLETMIDRYVAIVERLTSAVLSN